MRIRIMLLADEGRTQSQICKTLGCSYATARHWITIAQMGRAHLWKQQPVGRPNIINEDYLERLKELASSSPREHGYPFNRWTGCWLNKHLAKEFGIEVSDRHVNRLLKQMGLSMRSANAQTPKEIQNLSQNNSNIAIVDLKNTPVSNPYSFWSFNLLR
ncbi:MAG: helix-turn-helix domain-containing protein [Cyanobacteria bacterium RU_5_0]|nr:helix-turn-helix domain-containing protein [Cyanobacteria bacterium RU_5_0]